MNEVGSIGIGGHQPPASSSKTPELGGRAASKKKQKRSQSDARKVGEFCFEFARSGTCSFGEDCRFNHDYHSFLGPHNEFYELERKARDDEEESLNQAVGSLTSYEPFALPPPPFHRSYATAPGKDTSVVLHVHNNSVLALCLSETHPAFNQLRSMNDGFRIDLSNKPSCRIGDVLATLKLSSGTVFEIKTPLPGTVLEYNERLLDKPGLILEDPLATGFLALLKPSSPFHLFLPRYFRLIAISAEAEKEEGAEGGE